MKTIILNIDCLLNFLKIRQLDLLKKEYKKLTITNKVCNTLLNPSIPQDIRDTLKLHIENELIKVEEIILNTDVFDIYYELSSDFDNKILGENEISSLALAIVTNSCLAFNEPEIISVHLEKYGIICMTTVDILDDLLKNNHISEEEHEEFINELSEK